MRFETKNKNIFLSERLQCLKSIHILTNKIEPRNDICLANQILYYCLKTVHPTSHENSLLQEEKKKQRQKVQRDQRGDPKSEKQRWCWHFSRHGPRSQFNRKIKERTGAS